MADGGLMPQHAKGPGVGLAVTAMVLGICGIIPVLGIVTGLAGVILGAVVLSRRRRGKGMAIAGIVCGLALPLLTTTPVVLAVLTYTRLKKDVTTTISTLMTVETVAVQLDLYALHLNRYPTDEEGLDALVTKPDYDEEALDLHWQGPYLQAGSLVDAWGRKLRYKAPGTDGGGQAGSFRVWSVGPNGLDEDGAGDDIEAHRSQP